MSLDLPALLRPNCVRTHKWLAMSDEVCRRYNSHDTFFQSQLFHVLRSELQRAGQWDFYLEWRRIWPVAMRMQRRGFGMVDWDAHKRVTRELEEESREVEAAVLSKTRLFDDLRGEVERWATDYHRQTEDLRAAAETWKVESLEADLAAALVKNAKRKVPRPVEEVLPTKGKSREKGYEQRLARAAKHAAAFADKRTRKLAEVEDARRSFFNKSELLRVFLFDELGLPPAPASQRYKRGERSLKADAVQWMLEHLLKRDTPHREVLEDLSHIFRIRKIQQGYLEPLGEGPEWVREGSRLHPTIRLGFIETLRWSYARPSLHNWPPRMQEIAHAAPGCVFITCDYKAIEAGIAAILAGDEAEIREWSDPQGDLHRLMSLDALGMDRATWDGLDKDRRKAIRGVFKTARYERMYGGEGTKARSKEGCPCPRCRAEETGTSVKFTLTTHEMKRALERWAGRHPRMAQWREDMIRGVRNNGNSWTSPFGYRMVSCQPVDDAKRAWLNYPMQHCAAMVANRVAIDLDNLGAPLVFQHHDSLTLEVSEKHAAEWGQVMVEVMHQPIPELGNTRFPVDIKIGYTWAETK